MDEINILANHEFDGIRYIVMMSLTILTNLTCSIMYLVELMVEKLMIYFSQQDSYKKRVNNTLITKILELGYNYVLCRHYV